MGISSVNSGASSNANLNQSQTIRTLLTALERQPTLLDVLSEDSAGISNSFGDILDLSSEGQAAADQLHQLFESASLARVQKSADKVGTSLQERLSDTLGENGIDMSSKIDLQIDPQGKIVVVNDHLQKQTIEETVNNATDLKEAVAQYLESMQSLTSSLQGDSGPQSTLRAELEQLLASLNGESADIAPRGAVTFRIQDGRFQTLYQGTAREPLVLSSSEGQ